MKIAVIDDGIDGSRLCCPECLIQDLVVGNDGIVHGRKAEDFFLALHGTKCAQIIENYANRVDLISLCIFDKDMLMTNCEKLITALNWCLMQQVRLIHMSVGTRLLSDYKELQQVVARLVREGSIIVAAGSNMGTFTMPACLGGVLGVEADEFLTGATYRHYVFKNGIQIAASALHTFLETEKAFLSPIVNSFAAPTVTAAVCRILAGKEKAQLPELFKLLLPGNSYHMLHPDFLEESFLLNLSDTELFKEQFFFSYVEVKNVTDIPLAGRKKCLVFLPGKDVSQNANVIRFIQQHVEQFYGFVYGGRNEGNRGKGSEYKEKKCKQWKNKSEEALKVANLNADIVPELEDLREKLLFWWELDCGMTYWWKKKRIQRRTESLKNQEEFAPCILIQTTQNKGLRFAYELQHQFREMGYQCIAASNWEHAYLYGLEYIFPDIEKKQVQEYLEEVFDPDLVILVNKGESSWEIEKDTVYCIKEDEFEQKNIYEKIEAYFCGV